MQFIFLSRAKVFKNLPGGIIIIIIIFLLLLVAFQSSLLIRLEMFSELGGERFGIE